MTEQTLWADGSVSPPPATRKWCELVRLVHGPGCPFGDNGPQRRQIVQDDLTWPEGQARNVCCFSMPEDVPFNFKGISQLGELSSLPEILRLSLHGGERFIFIVAWAQ